MSISEAHSEAARRNGAQSHGPVTEEGRRRSSQNARKHNFFASYATLPDEDRAEFGTILDAYNEEYSPETITESHFVHDLADAEWRLQRVRTHLADLQVMAMTKFQPAKSSAEAFHYLAKDGPTLGLLLRYETKFQRQYDKALQQILALRDRRPTPVTETAEAPNVAAPPQDPEAASNTPAAEPPPDPLPAVIDCREPGTDSCMTPAEARAAAERYYKAWEEFIFSPTPGEMMGMDVAFKRAEEIIKAQKSNLQNEPKPVPTPTPADDSEPAKPIILTGRLITLDRK
ncbi:MAG: hypothetical protein HY820_22375 [Acidobacteria bacterium]|nr:hypothetical protein [Acidobacteriota bacterium]